MQWSCGWQLFYMWIVLANLDVRCNQPKSEIREGTSFTAWRPSLYMLHPEWMIHHGYYETAQLSESHVFGIWKEPIEQIIDWSKTSCVNFSTSTYHLALP